MYCTPPHQNPRSLVTTQQAGSTTASSETASWPTSTNSSPSTLRRFTSQGIEATAHVEIGPTVDLILKKAAEWNAAFIVVVGHKHNVAHRLVLGSVASTLLRVATQPVLVLPPPETSDGASVASVDRLIDLIDREDTEAELVNLREAAAAHLAEPTSPEGRDHLGGRLLDAVQGFEVNHPSITRAINDVSYYLSGIGLCTQRATGLRTSRSRVRPSSRPAAHW